MSLVNKVTLLGNTCQDPQVRTFSNGGKVAQFSLATNERAFKTKDGREIPERTEYHNIVISRNGLVDVAERFVHKGDKLFIEGELRTRQYEDNTGTKHYITEIIVSDMKMLTPKKQGQTTQQAAAAGTVPPPPQPDDLPF